MADETGDGGFRLGSVSHVPWTALEDVITEVRPYCVEAHDSGELL